MEAFMLIRPYINKRTNEAAIAFEFINENEFKLLIQNLENCLYYIGSCPDESISVLKDHISFEAIDILKERMQNKAADPGFSLTTFLTLNEASIFMTDILQTNTSILTSALIERVSLETSIAEMNSDFETNMFALFEKWASSKENKK